MFAVDKFITKKWLWVQLITLFSWEVVSPKENLIKYWKIAKLDMKSIGWRWFNTYNLVQWPKQQTGEIPVVLLRSCWSYLYPNKNSFLPFQSHWCGTAVLDRSKFAEPFIFSNASEPLLECNENGEKRSFSSNLRTGFLKLMLGNDEKCIDWIEDKGKTADWYQVIFKVFFYFYRVI